MLDNLHLGITFQSPNGVQIDLRHEHILMELAQKTFQSPNGVQIDFRQPLSRGAPARSFQSPNGVQIDFVDVSTIQPTFDSFNHQTVYRLIWKGGRYDVIIFAFQSPNGVQIDF